MPVDPNNKKNLPETIVLNDGTVVKKYSDGRQETINKNGSFSVRYPNGEFIFYNKNGKEQQYKRIDTTNITGDEIWGSNSEGGSKKKSRKRSRKHSKKTRKH